MKYENVIFLPSWTLKLIKLNAFHLKFFDPFQYNNNHFGRFSKLKFFKTDQSMAFRLYFYICTDTCLIVVDFNWIKYKNQEMHSKILNPSIVFTNTFSIRSISLNWEIFYRLISKLSNSLINNSQEMFWFVLLIKNYCFQQFQSKEAKNNNSKL